MDRALIGCLSNQNSGHILQEYEPNSARIDDQKGRWLRILPTFFDSRCLTLFLRATYTVGHLSGSHSDSSRSLTLHSITWSKLWSSMEHYQQCYIFIKKKRHIFVQFLTYHEATLKYWIKEQDGINKQGRNFTEI